ncbi:S41 family peptidase [Planctomycetes bacterium K23_9]|uniref:Carboxy-terminal processing protease CtpA n=1 Tax=Stieleria marina TaxID=1930275 RepID=A0A517P324_9BACT|nr:Carboxy-terminal processing protease CtpA precursor [Planctomycetes bacterium K23_9]
MLPRNLNAILIAMCVAVLCYATHRRTRTAMMVGDALELINQNYVDPVEVDDLLTAAMNGMTDALDENSSFIPGDQYESFQNSINQEFAGIGIFVEQPDKEKPVRVITPLVGSPALKAGILPNDRIISVDDVDVSTMELRAVSDRLKGPVGTTVKVGLMRENDETLLVNVSRATIELESVIGDHRDKDNHWVYRLKSDPQTAYVRLTSFGEKTVNELQRVLGALDNDFNALILDVRGNSGGLLYAARDISDMFLDEGKIVSTRIRGNVIEDVYEAQLGTLVDPGKPMVVLIDGGSASASEIVAASLQDHQRASIVGTRSYGKGTVQNILPLQFGRSALRLTVARYFRPSDKNIHRKADATEEDEWGVTPDDGLVVPVDDETLVEMIRRREQASYPLLADKLFTDQSSEENGGETGEGAEDSAKPVIAKSSEQSSVDFDPQLRQAVEHLKQVIHPASESEKSKVDEELSQNATKAAA